MRLKRLHVGKRIQEDAIDAIVKLCIDTPTASLRNVFSIVSADLRVPSRTLRNWYNSYMEWGEYPHETRTKIITWNRKCRKYRWTAVVNQEIVDALVQIVDEAPELYLDEIAEDLGKTLGVYLPLSTIYRTLTEKCNYSLQVCYESAKQRDEVERERYRLALRHLVEDAAQVLVVDETHKDKRASRRRRAWGRRNSGGIPIKRWFCHEIRYTMIAGFNIDGFVDSTVELFMRDEISNEGAAGTVDREMFVEWVRTRLCPVLGRYDAKEKNSIVIMDNALTHMCEEVRELIENTGAYLLCSAPYSPDLSPIEYGFHIYKAYLKHYAKDYEPGDWFDLHIAAMRSVSRDTALKEFRKCGIPHSDLIPTSNEMNVMTRYINSIYMNN